MPNKKSAVKSVRQYKKRNIRNRAIKSNLHTLTKKVRQAVEEKNVEEAKTALPGAIKAINKTAQKGVIHKKKAARLESRLVKSINNLSKSKAELPPSE